jgi:hypothetical protein
MKKLRLKALKTENLELKARIVALERENTLLSLIGAEAAARMQNRTGANRRVRA